MAMQTIFVPLFKRQGAGWERVQSGDADYDDQFRHSIVENGIALSPCPERSGTWAVFRLNGSVRSSLGDLPMGDAMVDSGSWSEAVACFRRLTGVTPTKPGR